MTVPDYGQCEECAKPGTRLRPMQKHYDPQDERWSLWCGNCHSILHERMLVQWERATGETVKRYPGMV